MEIINHLDVAEAIQQLKANKKDGDVALMSKHLLLCSNGFHSELAMLIIAILTHGYQPKRILLAKENTITICSSIGKLMDIILITRYRHMLQTSDMQFAFKEKHSTVMCKRGCAVLRE